MFSIRYGKDSPHWLSVLKSGALLWILVTGLVFHFMLSHLYHPSGILLFSNIILHYFVPSGMLINWLIFEEKGTFRHKYTFLWIAYPCIFTVLSLIRGRIDGFYPYWFVNPVQEFPQGAGSLFNVMIVVIILSAVFAAAGNLIVFLDKYLGKNNS
jgi:hypothetical protein